MTDEVVIFAGRMLEKARAPEQACGNKTGLHLRQEIFN